MQTQMRKIPVTIVTGFLGSGKTTLMRHILQHASGKRIAVIVNEFGELGIDGEILKGCGIGCDEKRRPRPKRNLYELANGCLCCTVQEEFFPVMEQARRAARADRSRADRNVRPRVAQAARAGVQLAVDQERVHGRCGGDGGRWPGCRERPVRRRTRMAVDAQRKRRSESRSRIAVARVVRRPVGRGRSGDPEQDRSARRSAAKRGRSADSRRDSGRR